MPLFYPGPGSATSITAPPPSARAARMVPPCSSTIRRATARPRPVPFALPVRNGSKIACSFPGGMPAPAQTMEQIERRAIEEALAAVGGNRRHAAERLGIGLRTLYERLKKYGLESS